MKKIFVAIAALLVGALLVSAVSASEITGCKPKWYGECEEFDKIYDEAIKRLHEKLLESKE